MRGPELGYMASAALVLGLGVGQQVVDLEVVSPRRGEAPEDKGVPEYTQARSK